MLRSSLFYLSVIVGSVMLVALNGCMGKSDPVRFYTLSSITESQVPAQGERALLNAAIGIGPVKVADYLDQSRIVTRTGDNRIEQAEFDQWSGSHKNNITNVLAENISLLVATGRVSIFPWRSYMPIDYQVTVDIVRFDGQLGGTVDLVARWSVLIGKEKKVLAMKRSDIKEKTGNGYDALVSAQSRALGRLSQEIAETIRSAGQTH